MCDSRSELFSQPFSSSEVCVCVCAQQCWLGPDKDEVLPLHSVLCYKHLLWSNIQYIINIALNHVIVRLSVFLEHQLKMLFLLISGG